MPNRAFAEHLVNGLAPSPGVTGQPGEGPRTHAQTDNDDDHDNRYRDAAGWSLVRSSTLNNNFRDALRLQKVDTTRGMQPGVSTKPRGSDPPAGISTGRGQPEGTGERDESNPGI